MVKAKQRISRRHVLSVNESRIKGQMQNDSGVGTRVDRSKSIIHFTSNNYVE